MGEVPEAVQRYIPYLQEYSEGVRIYIPSPHQI